MREIFVTGGAGFIGSAFIRLLIEETVDCRITNFDLLTYAGNPDNLVGLDQARHRFVHGDIVDSKAVMAAINENTDAVVNFAAESQMQRSFCVRTSPARKFCLMLLARAASSVSSRFQRMK